MLGRVLEDINCHPELAVQCCIINAKNPLYSVRGFVLYQLAIGKNNKLLSTLNDKAPTLTRQSVSKLASNNLDVILKARTK